MYIRDSEIRYNRNEVKNNSKRERFREIDVETFSLFEFLPFDGTVLEIQKQFIIEYLYRVRSTQYTRTAVIKNSEGTMLDRAR